MEMIKKRPLEPIQEESEQEDEENRIGEEEDFAFQMGVETEEILAEKDQEEEDDAPLRVLRPGRRSTSIREKCFKIQSNNHLEKTEKSSMSDMRMHAADLSVKSTQIPMLGNWRRSRSSNLQLKVRTAQYFCGTSDSA